ncbi:orexin receptor type 1-like [Chrysoperla carnea]|uniref:orexin receptor type 1-like n=1 Tax=Chrysoperla carnea TaxID=189513 RepID=UPI001D092312|nr:orexin receptor type 1-like [Chrysoperla carnea]
MRDSNDWIYTTVKMDYVTNDESSSFSSNIDDFPLSDNDLYYNESDYDDDECFSLQCMPYEDYVDRIRQEVINPSMPEWIFVGAHSIVFLVGLIGNALVCVAVYRNHSMRTVTNYFIVNLAVADFMVILFCLPPTVIWDITNTWFFGLILCKVVLYLQNVSVTVSVLTLTFISIDRWYAICYPLKFKSTTGRAKTAIIIIWFIALSTDIPELIVLTTVKLPEPNITEVYYTQCDVQWNKETDTIWNVSKTFILYIIPLIFMSFAYCQIVRVLWRTDKVLTHNNMNNHQTTSSTDQHHHHHHHHHHNHHNHQQNNQQQQQRYHPPASSASTPNTLNSNTRGLTCNSRRSTFLMNSNTTTEGQLRSRRKAAKMLVAVVVMFAVCYFPVHFLNIIRHLIVIEQTDCNAVLVLIAHWLIYANSAVNPVIYNFMSGKFRREFRRAFAQCHCVKNQLPNQYNLNNFSPHSTKSNYILTKQTQFMNTKNRKNKMNQLNNDSGIVEDNETTQLQQKICQHQHPHHHHHHHHQHHQHDKISLKSYQNIDLFNERCDNNDDEKSTTQTTECKLLCRDHSLPKT